MLQTNSKAASSVANSAPNAQRLIVPSSWYPLDPFSAVIIAWLAFKPAIVNVVVPIVQSTCARRMYQAKRPPRCRAECIVGISKPIWVI